MAGPENFVHLAVPTNDEQAEGAPGRSGLGERDDEGVGQEETLKPPPRKVHEQGPAAPKKGPRPRASRPRPFNALRWALVSIVAVVVVGAAYYLVVANPFGGG